MHIIDRETPYSALDDTDNAPNILIFYLYSEKCATGKKNIFLKINSKSVFAGQVIFCNFYLIPRSAWNAVASNLKIEDEDEVCLSHQNLVLFFPFF